MTDRFVGYMWGASAPSTFADKDDLNNLRLANQIFGTPIDIRTSFNEACTPVHWDWWFWLIIEMLLPRRQPVLCVWIKED